MAKFDKGAIDKALCTKWSKVNIEKIDTKPRVIKDISMAMFFSYYKFNRELVILHIMREWKRNRRNANSTVKKFIDKCEDAKVSINEAEHDKTRKSRAKEKPTTKGEVEKAVAKLSPVLDLFNVNKKGTLEMIQSIEDGNDFSQAVIIKSYKVLYTLLMTKAKGETVTKKSSVSYVLTDDGRGGFTKTIAKNALNEQRVFEETQSHLPDERAFAGALVVMEVIQNLEGGNSEFLTQEEKEDRYQAYLSGVKQEVIGFSEKEYTEAELEGENEED